LPPGVRVQEIVEPRQTPHGSLRERSPPGGRVQETAEPPQPMDELRQLAAELNRRLGFMGHGSGPADGLYPAQPTEQGMPSVARPDPRCGPTDERFVQRPVDEWMPSVVPLTHDPNVPFHIPSGDAYGPAYRHLHGLYPDGTPANCPHVPETPAIYFPARIDKEQPVLRQGHDPRQTMSRNTPDRR